MFSVTFDCRLAYHTFASQRRKEKNFLQKMTISFRHNLVDVNIKISIEMYMYYVHIIYI